MTTQIILEITATMLAVQFLFFGCAVYVLRWIYSRHPENPLLIRRFRFWVLALCPFSWSFLLIVWALNKFQKNKTTRFERFLFHRIRKF